MRSASTFETLAALVSRVLSCSSRAATFWLSRDSPRRLERTSSGVLRNVSARTFSDCASWSVSMRCSVLASPLNASTTSYGDAVRASGISESGSSWPEPAGSSARNMAPSSVLTRIEAPVSSPNSVPLSIRNFTSTCPSSSVMSSTWPTRTPATRTSSFGFSPPASLNWA